VWLGDWPVGVLKPGAVYNVNPDHLGAPLTVSDATGQIVWRWDRDPYGNGKPNENPSGLGAFTYNLRFPGQYYDRETELHYNYFRDYNPKTGRYVQADPIGLESGDMNLYAYVQNNPLSFIDDFGLAKLITKGQYAIIGPESHEGQSHVHWGTKSNPRSGGAVYEDGTCRHGDDPPKKVVDMIRKLTGWPLSNFDSFVPFIVFDWQLQWLKKPGYNHDLILDPVTGLPVM